MVSWLADNSTVLMVLFGLIALGLGFAWWSNRKKEYVAAAAAGVIVAAAAWLLGALYPTDRQRLIQTAETMADAIEKRNVDAFFKHVSATFNHATMNKSTFREYVDSRIKRHQVNQFSISGFDFGEISRTTKKGEIDFFIHARGNWEGELPLRCFAEFVLEGNDWRLKGFSLKLGNTGQSFPLPVGRF